MASGNTVGRYILLTAGGTMNRRTFVRTGLPAAAGLVLPHPDRSALWGAPPPGWKDILD